MDYLDVIYQIFWGSEVFLTNITLVIVKKIFSMIPFQNASQYYKGDQATYFYLPQV